MFNQVTTSSASFSTTPYVLQNLLAISQTISALPQASFPSVILPLTLQSHTSTSPTRKIFPNLPYSPPCITPIPSQRECLPPSIIHTTFSVLNKLYYSQLGLQSFSPTRQGPWFICYSSTQHMPGILHVFNQCLVNEGQNSKVRTHLRLFLNGGYTSSSSEHKIRIKSPSPQLLISSPLLSCKQCFIRTFPHFLLFSVGLAARLTTLAFSTSNKTDSPSSEMQRLYQQ